jgi:uncharacterized membrane protein YcaP (DUF421 family)
LIYTKALPIIGVVVVTHMVYLMAGLVLAFRSRLEGARIFLWVSVITLVTVINDFLYYSELSPVGNTSPLGLLVFTIAQMMLISASSRGRRRMRSGSRASCRRPMSC